MKLVASMVALGALSIPVHASFGEFFTIRTKLLREHGDSAVNYTSYDNRGVLKDEHSARALVSEHQCSSLWSLDDRLLGNSEFLVYPFRGLLHVGLEPLEITDGGILKKRDYPIEQSAFKVCHDDAEDYLRWDPSHADTPANCTAPLVLLTARPYSLSTFESAGKSNFSQGHKHRRSELPDCYMGPMYPLESQPSNSIKTYPFRSDVRKRMAEPPDLNFPRHLSDDEKRRSFLRDFKKLEILNNIDWNEAQRKWDELWRSHKAELSPEDAEALSRYDDLVEAMSDIYDQSSEAAAKTRGVSLQLCSSWQVVTALIMALAFL